MPDRRTFMLASLAALAVHRAPAAATLDATDDIDRLGAFDRILGRPGVVVGVPHGTPDAGTLDIGRILCTRLGCSGVFVTGFWDTKTRQRVNVNRPTEQIIGQDSQVVRQWKSARAQAANARYHALVKETAQGPLTAFYEIHSNHRARYAHSVEVSTLGVPRAEAARFRDAFVTARDRLAADVPRLAIHVSPLDSVTFPNYSQASSISKLSVKGCAIEHPGRVVERKPWRIAYAECLAEAIRRGGWS